MNAIPHACGHQTAATVGVQQVMQVMASPAVTAEPSLFPPVSILSIAGRFAHVEQTPPRILALTTQLRV